MSWKNPEIKQSRLEREYSKPETKVRKSARVFEDLSEKQKAFARNIVSGMSLTDAYFSAGFMAGYKKDSRDNRTMACSAAGKLMRNELIRAYVVANTKLSTEMSPQGILKRMEMIMNGRIYQSIVTKKGEVMQVPPGFKEQVLAGQLMYRILKGEEKSGGADGVVAEVSEVVKGRALALIGKFNNAGASNAGEDEDEDEDEDEAEAGDEPEEV